MEALNIFWQIVPESLGIIEVCKGDRSQHLRLRVEVVQFRKEDVEVQCQRQWIV